MILHGDVLDMLRTLDSESVHCCVTSHNDGRFKKGQHWRPKKPFWDKEWLETEYLVKQRSSSDIAKEFKVGDTAIHFWLKKHNIPTRNVSEARAIKKWGLSGKQNGMYGRNGKTNPRWNGGHSPERQTLYARSIWKEIAKSILARDDFKCRKCGIGHNSQSKLVVHHIKHWAKHPELRFDKENLITLCQNCHKEQHRR